jgi:hypothetical protein
MATIEGVDAMIQHRKEEITRTGFYTKAIGPYTISTICTFCGCVVGDREIHRRACDQKP